MRMTKRRRLLMQAGISISAFARMIGASRASAYAYLAPHGGPKNPHVRNVVNAFFDAVALGLDDRALPLTGEKREHWDEEAQILRRVRSRMPKALRNFIQ